MEPGAPAAGNNQCVDRWSEDDDKRLRGGLRSVDFSPLHHAGSRERDALFLCDSQGDLTFSSTNSSVPENYELFF